jgi:signal transduction histidine kinase
MRLIDLPRTSSFRLALLFVVLFGLASLTQFGFLYLLTERYLLASIDDWLSREQYAISSLSAGELVTRLNRHALDDPGRERPFVWYDASGNRLAGSAVALPPAPPLDRPFDFSVQESDRIVNFRGRVHRQASGNLLLIARDERNQRAFDLALVTAVLAGGVVTAGLGLAGAAVIGAGAVRRIDAVTRAIQRIVAGDLSGRLPSRGTSDDLDRLVHVVNDMLGEIERLMHEVKSVCDNIAHDLRTPLTRLLAGLERGVRRAETPEQYAACVQEAIVETKSLLKTFNAMLRISEVEDGARRAGFAMVSLSQAVQDAAEFYEPLAEAKGVTLVASAGASDAELLGDPNLLFEAIGNLLDNAIKFTPNGGRVTVRAFQGDGGTGIVVSDTGPGIPVEERECVLRRFYRAETSRHTPGSGLGLALVAAIARLHGLDLTIADASPGCRITLSCPASRQATQPRPVPALADARSPLRRDAPRPAPPDQPANAAADHAPGSAG